MAQGTLPAAGGGEAVVAATETMQMRRPAFAQPRPILAHALSVVKIQLSRASWASRHFFMTRSRRGRRAWRSMRQSRH